VAFASHLIEAVAGCTLLVGQYHQGFAAGNFWQPGGLGGGIGIARQHATSDQGLGKRFEHIAAPQLLHHHHAFDRTHAQATIVLGDVQAAQAQFGNFAPGRAVKAASLFAGAAAVEGIALVHPFAHSVAELYLVVRKIEVQIHQSMPPPGSRYQLRTVCETMLRCTSLEPP
jgi:hypothetical protein